MERHALFTAAEAKHRIYRTVLAERDALEDRVEALMAETIGQRIRRARLRKGTTQAELGALVGMRRFYVSDLERGMRPTPRADTIRRLAEALDVEELWLAYGEDDRVDSRYG